MKFVVLGLTLSSSWGNGHATTYRALLSAFAARGHEVLFLERDLPWYAEHRDLPQPEFCTIAYYDKFFDLEGWRAEIASADAVMVGSYVPEGIAAGDWVQRHASGLVCFYDIDTPVTLAQIGAGSCEFLTHRQIPGYDIYFSFAGGPTLRRLEQEYGSPCAKALYCSVDTARYRPLTVPKRWDLTYLGTYSADRQPALEALLLDVARVRPDLRFAVAGSRYPETIRWPENVERIEHLPPAAHPEFYAASRFTLNVTRADMIAAGWSPSVRLFEAGACGTAIVTDRWPGFSEILPPEQAAIIADDTDDVLAALECDPQPLGQAARAQILAHHSAAVRAAQLEGDLMNARGDLASCKWKGLVDPCTQTAI